MKKQKVIDAINPVFLDGVAHRGLHNSEYTENGLKAFKNAIDNGVAFEFDIHLSKDKKLIVCHDSSLKRTSGKDGIIEELTLEEIKNNYQLLDGSSIPTLDDVMELNQERVPMVIEIKTKDKNYKEITDLLKEELKKIKDKSKIMIISFDARTLWRLKKSGYMRGLLISYRKDYVWHVRNTVESLDLDRQFFKRKNVIRYAKKHFMNVWTIETKEALEEVLPYVDTVTYQYLDPLYVKQRLNEKNLH